MTISASDFDFIDREAVRHRQTGATWLWMTADGAAGRSLQEQPGKTGEGHYPTLGELRPYAVALLRRIAQRSNARR